jgi:hypothetical protein
MTKYYPSGQQPEEALETYQQYAKLYIKYLKFGGHTKIY